MNITIKDPEEIELMRESGRLASSVLDMIGPHIKPGVTTEQLDNLCHSFIINELDAIPAPLNYHGFPKSICTSVNHVVCHGIPGERILKDGDIINVDITVIKNGYHGDTSRMFTVGETSILSSRLISTCYSAMWIGINQVKPGCYLGDIGSSIQAYVEEQRFSVVREYCGHGIGKEFHEDPQVLHYGKPRTGFQLLEGMTLTIEPMINAGKRAVKLLNDNWTVITKDRSLSAQWEHTLLVTHDGFEVLTLSPSERLKHGK
jgi:methionyl aminopeptidase